MHRTVTHTAIDTKNYEPFKAGGKLVQPYTFRLVALTLFLRSILAKSSLQIDSGLASTRGTFFATPLGESNPRKRNGWNVGAKQTSLLEESVAYYQHHRSPEGSGRNQIGIISTLTTERTHAVMT